MSILKKLSTERIKEINIRIINHRGTQSLDFALLKYAILTMI